MDDRRYPRQPGQSHRTYLDEQTSSYYPHHDPYAQNLQSSLYPSTDQNERSSPLESDDGVYSYHQPHTEYPASVAGPSRSKQSESPKHTLSSLATIAHKTRGESSKLPPASGKSGKSRRERPRIKLAQNQPNTTQGKARERVYVACVQCRTRKIRCDGDKPSCYNCTRRPQDEEPCCYDNNPKRRGPDKVPGARQRMARHFHNELEAQGLVQPSAKRRRRRTKDKDPLLDDPEETPISHAKLEGTPVPTAHAPVPVIQIQPTVTAGTHQTTDSHPDSDLSIIPGYYADSSTYGQSELPLAAPEVFPETESQYQWLPIYSNATQVPRAVSSSSAGSLFASPNAYSPAAAVEAASFVEGFSHHPAHGSIHHQHLTPSPHEIQSPLVDDYPPQASSYHAYPVTISPSDTTPYYVQDYHPQDRHTPPSGHRTHVATRPLISTHLAGNDHLASVPISTSVTQRPSQSVSPISTPFVHEQHDVHSVPSYGYITEIDEDEDADNGETMYSRPSHQFTRQVWWDSLLSLYHDPFSNHLVPISAGRRNEVASEIVNDLKFIFRASNYWFSFFHVPRFFATYHNAQTRSEIQPALILILITMSIFFRSSEREGGAAGRERALRFRDHAQAALEASFNSGWIDETLAQAAFLLAMFEGCCHAQNSSLRVASSLTYLDSIIRSLKLTYLDADDPAASNFDPHNVPLIESHPQTNWQFYYQNAAAVSTSSHPAHSGRKPGEGCSCRSLTLGATWPKAQEFAPLWVATPGWNPDWTDGQIRQESIRRVCWTTMVLAANNLNYWSSIDSVHRPTSLFVAEPANYALLFPGETLASDSLGVSSKDTIWALYDRAFILWHGCNNMRNDVSRSQEEKTQFAMLAWHAADKIEKALNAHTCDLERAFVFQGREYLFNTRMTLSFDFQKNIPMVAPDINHRKATEWLTHQQGVARRFIELASIVGNAHAVLSRRPFFVFWFMAQMSRALRLWEQNEALVIALDVCKALLPPIDYLTELWPCAAQRNTLQGIRSRLDNACRLAGVVPPPPAPLASLPF